MKFPIILVAAASLVSSASAVVTVNIKSSGWGDSSTAGVNGMTWGLLVGSNGADFSGQFLSDLSTGLLGFEAPTIANPATGVHVFGDYYFVRALSDTTGSGPPLFESGYMNDVRFSLDSNVSEGDNYALLWLPNGDGTVSAGDAFGFQDLSRTIPSDGTTTANIGGTPSLAEFNVVPEPSTYAAIAGLVVLGFAVVRRRRQA